MTVGKLYGGVLIYEIWKTTRFSNLEILAKMEEEMEEKEALARGETLPPKEKEGGEKKTTNMQEEVQGDKVEQNVATGDENGNKMSRENSYDR